MRMALVLAMAGVALGCRRPPPPPPPAPAPVITVTSVDAEPVALPEPEPPDEEVRPDAAPETVTIKLVADERKQAHVFWGRKDLGVAPLEVTRPRGSGPLDLVVLADGYLPLHTRAFTDRNETVVLRLYTAAEATGLPGYAPPPPSATKPTTKPATKLSPKAPTAPPTAPPTKAPTKPPMAPPTKNPGIKPTTDASKAHP
jgi:hypothetical protein